MFRWLRICRWRLSSEIFDVRFGQLACFTAAPVVFYLALTKLAKLPLTATEAFLGILASLTLCLLMVVLGMLLPLTQRHAAVKSEDPVREQS